MTTERPLRMFLLFATCAIAAALLFCLGLGGTFLMDDKPTIVENAALHIATLDADSLMQAAYGFEAGGGSRALPMLTFAFDFWRSGLDPAAFKATNIVIHGLTTLALAFFFRLLLRQAGWRAGVANPAAMALAVAWAIHPLQVSSVLYVVQRMQTMSTLFLVLALWSYLRARQAQIQGGYSRLDWIMAALFGVLAFASKEDAIMLPAYAFALEATVLRFQAARPGTGKAIRRTYLVSMAIGAALFLLVALPRFWSWEAYPSRDFNSYERLLTEARVLAMYLGQIVLPLPGRMPFFYDGLQPSRGLLSPGSTLLSLAALAALAFAAWRLRRRRPLFALGVLLFFLGHAITASVIGLELAFEHRNHFPLAGAVLAIGDLLAAAAARLRLPSRATAIAGCLLVASLASATVIRLHAWGSPMRFSQESTRIAPDSVRAWTNLCQAYHDLSSGNPRDANFGLAIAACEKAGGIEYGVAGLSSLIVLKSTNGTIAEEDWNRLLARLQKVTMTAENMSAAWYLASHSYRNKLIDEHGVVKVIDLVVSRVKLGAPELGGFGYYMLEKDSLQQDAYRYFAMAIRVAPPKSKFAPTLLANLRKQGHHEMANRLEQAFANPGTAR